MLEATALVLAGGKSSRLGKDKAFIKLENGESLLESAIRRLKDDFTEVLVSANDLELFGYLGLPLVQDFFPGRGPLAGLHAGLKAAAFPYVFVVACDMPFFSPGLARYLLEEAPGHDVVVPKIDEYLQPLHAIYGKSCLEPIEQCLLEDKRRVVSFYPLVKVKYVGGEKLDSLIEADRVFFNINTGEDLEEARRMVSMEERGHE